MKLWFSLSESGVGGIFVVVPIAREAFGGEVGRRESVWLVGVCEWMYCLGFLFVSMNLAGCVIGIELYGSSCAQCVGYSGEWKWLCAMLDARMTLLVVEGFVAVTLQRLCWSTKQSSTKYTTFTCVCHVHGNAHTTYKFNKL